MIISIHHTGRRSAFLLLAALVLASIGCESSDKTEPLNQATIMVDPAQAEVGPNGSVEFVASGWPDYVWSLRDANLGVLSNRSGERTRYTRISGSNTVQVLTVRPGQSNTNNANIATQVVIRHR